MARLFLDAHISSYAVAAPLRARGHDVRCVDEERALDGFSDELLLALASDDRRVLVTANVKDFLSILTAWAGSQRHHAGCVLIPRSVGQHRFGTIIAGLELLLAAAPDQSQWQDLVRWLPR